MAATFQSDTPATPPRDLTVATDVHSSAHYQVVKMAGQDDSGTVRKVAVTGEGHVEVSLHSPRLPFGSLHVESMSPVFNTDAVYGINPFEVLATTGLAVGTGANSAAATGANNLFTCSTGNVAYSFASIQSRKRLRYRAGQGIIGRFAGLFSEPAANTVVVAGFGTAESGCYFGYNGTAFGILHSTGGVREIQTLTVTTASTNTANYVVTLPNTTSVNVAATNSNSTVRTAYEIAQGTYPGWSAEARGSTVVFLSASVGPVTGAFSLAQTGAGTPAAGTVAETVAGVAATDTWVPQTEWNGDKLDGSGPSGITLNPQKGSPYEIDFQYLGFGTIVFKVEVAPANGNNAEYVTVHTLKFPNTRTTPTFRNPSFPFTMAAYSAGSTTDVSVSVGSFAGFVEGAMVMTGPRMTYFNNVSTSTSAYTPMFTVRNSLVYNGKANQSVVNLLSISGAAKSTTGLTTLYLIRNATLTGAANFTQFATTSSTYWDTAATACTFATNDQVVYSASISESGDFTFSFSDGISLQPGETLTLAGRSVTATAVAVGSINTREDQ